MDVTAAGRALLFAAAAGFLGVAHAAERIVDRTTMRQLSGLHPGDTLTLQGFPVGADQNASVRLQRVQIYAPDARIYVITASGRQEVPRSTRIYLRGDADDGSARVAMSLDPSGTFIEGNGSGAQGSFVIDAATDAGGAHTFSTRPLQATLPSDFSFEFRCGNENERLDLHAPGGLAAQLQLATHVAAQAPAATTAAAFRTAVVAVDTDSLFMTRLFANNTTAATNWIAGMFNTMNAMYENDLQVQLLIGTTILRTSAANDPYAGFTPGASTAELSFFANYWQTHEAGVPRAFAALLSGQIASTANSCNAAGIAWINQYCQTGFASGGNTVGSYSLTQVCTSANIDPNGAFDARIVGHEIGHNFGAWHTHCTNASSGAAPVASNTIDVCYNQESSLGCYAGPTSCPAAGSGTIMSYCNFTSVSGCAPGTQNQLHFHPTQINDVLLPAIAAHTPGCLGSGSSDIIFRNGFGG